MIKLLRQLFGIFIALILVSSAIRVLGWIYGAVTPEPLPYSDSQRQAAQAAGQEVQTWLSTLTIDRGSAAFGNLEHDPFGLVGQPVRDAIWRSGRFDLAPRSFWERLRSRIGWTVPVWPVGNSLDTYARFRGTQLAIGGSVVGFADDAKPGLQLHLEIVDAATGHRVAAKDFGLSPSALGHLLHPKEFSHFPARDAVLIWFALILLLPLCILPFGRSLLIEGSNSAILLTLFGLVAFDVAAGYLLYAGHYPGWQGVAVVVVLVGGSLALNFKYLTFMKDISL